MPLHVLIYGSNGSGVATAQFDYRNGKPTHIRIIKSSGNKYEDVAAIEAVQNAHYPKTPPIYRNQTMRLEVDIHFVSVSPSSVSSRLPLKSATPPVITSSVITADTRPIAATATASSALQASASIFRVGKSELSNQTGKLGLDHEQPSIRIVSTSWNDPNSIRPVRMQVRFKNISDRIINSVWLFVSKCAVKGSYEVIPYSLELLGPFEPGNNYSGSPTFPANYTEFTGPWLGIEGGRYSTHMLITKINILYADGAMESYGDNVSELLSPGISNFCSSNYH